MDTPVATGLVAVLLRGCAGLAPDDARQKFLRETVCDAGYEPVYEPPITGCWPVLPPGGPGVP